MKFPTIESKADRGTMSRDAGNNRSRTSLGLQAEREPTLEIIPVFRTLSVEIKNPAKKKAQVAKGEKDWKKEDIHIIPLEDLYNRLGARTVYDGGMLSAVAAQKLKFSGSNTLTPVRENQVLKVLGFFFGGFCMLMWCAAIIVFLSYWPLPQLDNQAPSIYNLALVVLLLVVILFQGVFYAWQDWSSSSVMKKIHGLLAQEAIVFRDGKSMVIPASQVVVGDIIELKLGAKVPADCRIIECSGDLAFDRSILTGEAIAVKGNVANTDPSFTETKNIAFMGTSIVNGSGKAVVVFTGDNTMMGHIASLTAKKKVEQTLLQKEIINFVTFVAGVAFFCGIVCMLIWGFVLNKQPKPQYDLIGMLGNLCGIIVAFVPEGLPICMSVTLTVIARKMAKQNVLVKNLTTIETLGAVSVICSDKTGTLTQNKMTVTTVSFGGDSATKPSPRTGQLLHRIAAQCCDAKFQDPDTVPLDKRTASGDATDIAVLKYAEAQGSVAQIRSSFKKIFTIPFNSRNKWMLTMQEIGDCEVPELCGSTLFIKGAPDILFEKVTHTITPDGSIVPFSGEIRQNIQASQLEWAGQGKRVIAVAYKKIDEAQVLTAAGIQDGLEPFAYASIGDLTLVGLLGIVDPPRPEIRGTIETCRKAHIRVAMVTGDFSSTAVAIARDVGIVTASNVDTITDLDKAVSRIHKDPKGERPSLLDRVSMAFRRTSSNTTNPAKKSAYLRAEITEIENDGRAIVISGSELSALTDEHWDKICSYQELVFARTSPEQKLMIVEEFKKRQEIVAVTGDGVNDSPALKAANVGVAMGGGSEVAMESASLVLVDNNFSSLLAGIESGRLCFDNIKKVIMYLIPSGSWSELWPVLLSVFLGIPLPLNAALCLVVCCITDVFPSIALIYESSESDLMTRPPRNPKKDKLVDGPMFIHVYFFIGMMECVFAHVIFSLYFFEVTGVGFKDFVFQYGNLTNDPILFPNGVSLSQAQYQQVLYSANSVYFVALVVMQLFGNMYASRTRFNSVIQQNPFWGPTRNLYLVGCTFASLAFTAIFVYTPAFNNLFQCGPIPAKYWFIPIGFGMIIIVMDELRKLAVRIYGHDSFIGKISW
ncbi:uncharacterized protein BJ171DRAFT_208309 [Polychytrium aggregatum]|uniref:uncharacterized protein n=1 Tax=Polychytrium aggregatum TaxID=110093 RepID=UPI0022FEA3FE|nr:uncharacterized protein BJ171DRAFT_208309 [Polychytrium aggregatum]KAI9208476.1 hypothetical protein BJ171DRAFT_208309 [Polychytrium aggregatum]